MEALPDATLAEERDMPDWICTFHRWMLANGKKEGTAKAYASQIRILYEDDGKGPSVMATPEYFELTKASYKNRIGNGQRSASVRAFMEFYPQHIASGAKLEDASLAGLKIYQVKDRAVAKERDERREALLAEGGESEEAKRMRAELALPANWRVVVRERTSGDLLAAVSPGGRAYTSRQAVDERLGRTAGAPANGASGQAQEPEAEPAPPPPTAASKEKDKDKDKDKDKASRKQAAAAAAPPATKAAAPPPAKAAAAAPQPPATKPAAAPAALPAPSPAAASSAAASLAAKGLARRTLPLPDALTAALAAPKAGGSASSADGEGHRDALLVIGRDPSKQLAPRLLGLYLSEGPEHVGVYRKADHEKQTLIFFSKDRGTWRFTHSLDTKADFAKVKDKADAPWKVAAPWRVFDGISSYEEDPDLRVCLLDPTALPGVEVEVCLPISALPAPASPPAAAEATPAKRSRRGGGGAADAAASGAAGGEAAAEPSASKRSRRIGTAADGATEAAAGAEDAAEPSGSKRSRKEKREKPEKPAPPNAGEQQTAQ